ncbi:annexin ANNAT3 [Cinnamomum micranthum f. kanehirae]|uniref:Annexin n=1 Tax=Cinnamomum micranthum f. kanehirae TaxID=337451 RepID=A0A3S3MH85_9MAGN|nr:annexin ANNAT3 [Cinnamomum micranthum f. kanehirae]
MEMGSITIPDPVPSPTQDSEKLRKAFLGLGTDEQAIIDILGHRNANQRMRISQAYQQLYNQSLIYSLHSELSGDFGKAVIMWATDPPERDAKLAQEALRRKGLKHLSVIIEIACASSPHHLIAVRQAYCFHYNCSLEEDITLHVAQPLRKLLLAMVSSYRYEREEVDETLAKSEAVTLHDSIEKKKLDQEHVLWILSTRNKFQLKATFNCYRQCYGKAIDQAIKDRSRSDYASLLRTVICCIDSPEKHFAEVVKASVQGLGTDEDSLTRAIVTRAEIDLVKVKEEYLKLYKTRLIDDVVGDTSGDYKNFLVTLIGDGEQHSQRGWFEFFS